MKQRSGGIAEYRQRVLDGDVAAMRALVRQVGVNTLTIPVERAEVRLLPNGSGGDRLTFDGAFTTLDAPYQMMDWAGDYEEVVRSGALDKTLAEGADIQFVLNHNWDAAPMARTVAGSLQVNPDGTCQALIDGTRSDVHIVASALEGGELNAMSFAFYVTSQEWSPDYLQRDIRELDMDGGDVSVVTFPANPGTAGSTSIRKRNREALLRSGLVPILQQRAEIEQRVGATLSAATMETLQAVLDLIADADEAVDAAQVQLSALMGVPNPDDADGYGDDTGSDADPTETDASEPRSAGPDPHVVRQRLALAARR